MKVIVSDLKKHFGTTRAVDGLSFGFESGQIVAFVGPNGAGKTTTMRILATLDEPTGGDAYFDGTSVVEEPEKVRRLIGFMPDSLPTHRDMSVHEYLDFFARAYGIRNPQRDEVVESIEQFTNLVGIREKMLGALSKGMKQRVSLARALVHDPDVLIMDEPAAGLDPRARIELRELLKVLAGQDKAILISSHILCNGAVIIEQGKLIRAGTIDELTEADSPFFTVEIRPMGNVDQLQKSMLEMPFVLRSFVAGEEVIAEIEGREDQASQLLAELVKRGHVIAEFKRRKAHLEQIFMNVTKGDVQ
ncbi:MAG: ABC transporter ATP-binding protein [Planctomycetota bacterium]